MPVCSGPRVSWWGLLLYQFPKGNPWCPAWRKGDALGMLGAQLGRDSVGSWCRLAQPWDLSLWLFNPLEVSLSFWLCGGIRGQIGGPGVQPGLHPIQRVPLAHQRGVPSSRCSWPTRGASHPVGASGPPEGPKSWVLWVRQGCRLFGCQPRRFDPAGCVEWAAGLSSSLPALRWCPAVGVSSQTFQLKVGSAHLRGDEHC